MSRTGLKTSFDTYRRSRAESTSDEDEYLITLEEDDSNHSVFISETESDDSNNKITFQRKKGKAKIFSETEDEDESDIEDKISSRMKQSNIELDSSNANSEKSDIAPGTEDNSKSSQIFYCSRSEKSEESNEDVLATSKKNATAISKNSSNEMSRGSNSRNINSESVDGSNNAENESRIEEETSGKESDENQEIATSKLNRTSTNFRNSISQKLSSTMLEDSKHLTNISKNSKIESPTSSPISTSLKNTNNCSALKETVEHQTIQGSSRTSEAMSSARNTILICDSDSHEESMPEVISPKTKTVIENVSQPSNQEKRVVSKQYYEEKMKKLQDLKNELTTCQHTLETLGSKLPDKGQRLFEHCEKLKNNCKKVSEEIATIVVDDKPKTAFFNKEPPTWDEIAAAADQIQPKFTGKVGISKFNTQKTLTIERLKHLHGSLETCPAEDVLVDEPQGLKSSLMDHQRHAIAWMKWRERQRPRGGILADDMGLGKTLTMISLILYHQQNKEQEEENESDEDRSVEGSDNEWKRKGRNDYYRGGTLVVCPASLLGQWEHEVQKHTKRNILSVCVHHGNNREEKSRRLAKHDLVITTYNIASREHKTMGALYNVKWERIVLDEAHIIRNHKTQTSLAVCKLMGKYRWTLTGTPVQNKEIDLFALLKFLRCSPFDEISHWKKWIEYKSSGNQQRLNTLMKSLMLRRTKEQLQNKGELNCLPEKTVQLVEVKLEKEEMNVYQRVIAYSRTLFATYLHQRAEKNNDLYIAKAREQVGKNDVFYKVHQKFTQLHGTKEVKSHEILVLLLRLRQICDHPGLIDAMLENKEDISQIGDDSDETSSEINLLEQFEKLQINEENNDLSSPSEHAKGAVSKILLRSNPVFDLKRLSSKIKKVLEVLKAEVLSTNDKAIIVSQWTSVLDIVRNHLINLKVRTSLLSGSVAVAQRQNIIKEFNDPTSSVKILLLSLTAGGVGLNLVGANHLFLMDLHWNPQLEFQAQDRIYRVGQNKPVFVYRFMCKDTVEERIKALQDQKVSVANGIFTGVKAAEGSKLTIDDLKNIFGL